jgi:hypothetical protein
VGAGVTGSPSSGNYSHDLNEVVPYGYSLQPGYRDLTVTLDGADVPANGSVTITGNHTLSATAEAIDIRGKWTGLWEYKGYGTYFEVTFSGDVASGTTSGLFDLLPGMGNGQFTVEGDQVEFTLVYGQFHDVTLTCTGVLTDENHLSGDWILFNPGNPYELDGTWTLER